MSLDIYSSVLQPHQTASAKPPPPPPNRTNPFQPINSPRNNTAEDLSTVEQRLLDFFPAAFTHTTSTAAATPRPTQPVAAAAAAAAAVGGAKVVVPPTPKLLSALHSRTPSISPFTRMGLEYADEVDGPAGEGRTAGRNESAVVKETDEESKEEDAAGMPGRGVKQATAELVFATRQRRSTLREKMAHSRQPSLLSSPAAAYKADEPAVVAVTSAPAGEQQRGRRIISNARMMNAANRPILHTAAPLSPNSALSAPPVAITSQPVSPAADSQSSEVDEGSVRHKKKKPSAFLSHLAGLIKTPMTATSPSIPRYLAAVEAGVDATQPASPTAATAAAAIEQSRTTAAAAAAAQQAAKQAMTAPENRQAITPTASSGAQLAAATQQQAAEEAKTGKEQEKPDQSVAAASIAPAGATAVTVAQPTKQRPQADEEQKVKTEDDEDDTGTDCEDGEDDEEDDDDSYNTDSSSDCSQQRVASASDSDSDTFIRSLSSMWSTAKRRQDKQLAKEQRQAAERTQQQRLYGKTLMNGGVIVEREGGRMKKEVRRAVRSGKSRDGVKLTLEERKAMKMAAVYRQREQKVQKTAARQEERREQEEADDKPNSSSRPLTPNSAARALAVPDSIPSQSSPTSPRRRTAPIPSSTPFVPVRYDAPAMPAEPLPARPPTEVVFGRSTPLTEEQKARRTKQAQRRGPSLFDLAYGTAAVEPSEAHNEQWRRTVKAMEEEDDTAVPHPTAAVVLPASVLRAPPVSSHVISEGVAAGLPFSIRAIKRRAAGSAAIVPADTDVAAIAQQAIRQHKHNTAPPPSTALNTSTLSHKAVSFPRAARSPSPSKPAQPTAGDQQQPPSVKRPRMAAKTKAHLDRLHAAHREQQQRLQRERREKEERAMEGCTFVPQLAARSEKMAERRRMADEVQMRLYDVLRGRKQQEKERRRGDEEAETEAVDDAPITWGWQDADQPSPAPTAAADGQSSAVGTLASTPGSISAGKRDKLSRAEVMHAQHRIQQERLREQKQLEDQQRAQQQLAHCTFVPHTNYYAAPAPSGSTALSTVPQEQSATSASPAEGQSDEQPPSVPAMVVQKMQTSYEEQFVRETSRRQSHESSKQQQQQEEQHSQVAQSAKLNQQPSNERKRAVEEDEDEDDLFATADVSTARSAAPPLAPPLAQHVKQAADSLDATPNTKPAAHSVSTAWPVPEPDQYEEDDDEKDEHSELHSSYTSHSAGTDGAIAVDVEVEVERRDSLHTSFAWAVPAFATDTGEGSDELDSPVQSYPEVVEADGRQRDTAEETDEELHDLFDTRELAHFRSTLLAAQMPTLPNEPDQAPTEAHNEVQTAALSSARQRVEAAGGVREEENAGLTAAATADGMRPLLYVDIALSADRVETMQLCDGDDLLRAASEFCAKHGLHADYVSIIEQMLQQRLQQTS